MSFTLAIIGRPNVGKSTLFNRLVGRRIALVDNQPGVTRDIREGDGRVGDLKFTVIDTAGLEDAPQESLTGRMRRLTERAVDQADICLFLVDAKSGITPQDHVFADLLRKRAEAVILGVNKAEGRAGDAGVLEAFALGLGDPIALAAEHGMGMGELYAALRPLADARAAEIAAAEAEALGGERADDAPYDPTRPIRIAIIGRPNAGKSTLVNAVLGEDRLLTGPEPGITRDSIGLDAEWAGRRVKIFDTAGMRKRARVRDKIEKLSVSDGLRAVRFAEVVVVLLDVANPLEQQDLRIADLAEREGRAVVIALNKWDLEREKQARLKEVRAEFERLLPQLRGAPLVAVSALTGKGLDRLMAEIGRMHEVWNRRIATSPLNRWLRDKVKAHPPPAPAGRRLKLRYMTQIKARPPSFLLFCPRADALPDSYIRYLVNGLREDFNLPGVPIRIALRKGENPYDKG